MSIPPANSPNRPANIIGVEGGGTKTVAWIATIHPDGTSEIRGRGASGPSNIHAVGLNSTLDHVLEAIRLARSAAGLSQQPADAVCLAMAGVDRPQEAELFTQWAFAQKLAVRVKVTNDCEGLLAAGTKEGWGVALVAGTGSITFGQTPDGTMTRTGGWGYLMGDEGSAYTVALAGLKAAVRAADGRDPGNQLLPDFLERLELHQPEDLLQAIYLSNHDRAWIASLADVVTAAADRGDGAANGIIDSAAGELALLIATTARKLHLQSEPIPLCYTGGLILNSPALQARLEEELTGQQIRLAEYVAVEVPVWGAIKLAKQLLDSESRPE
jgi:N-acetylglucosamine kinase-like BadF-type ATPase